MIMNIPQQMDMIYIIYYATDLDISHSFAD